MRRSVNWKKAGFTLAETLVAMILLLIISVMLIQGIPLAYNAYKKVDQTANAHMLASTTMTELRDKLAFSKEIKISGDNNFKTISFTSNNGREYSLYCDIDKGGLYLEDLTDDVDSEGKKNSDSHLLVSNSASAKELYADFKDVTIDGDVMSFTNLAVYFRTDRNKDKTEDKRNPFIVISKYDIRLLNNGD